MDRRYSVLLALTVIVAATCMVFVSAQSDSDTSEGAFTVGGINYVVLNETNKTAKVVKYDTGSPYSGNITIPTSVTYDGNYSVTEIGAEAFKNCSGITSINIPNSITKIDNGAFWSCTGLSTIDLPSSIKTIGRDVFRVCTKITSIDLGNLTAYGEYSLSDCTQLTHVVLPATDNIPMGTLKSCTSLEEINIPASVETINIDSFMGCTSLKTLTLPSATTKIKDSSFGAFKNCTALTSVYMPGVTSVGQSAFEGCTGLTSVSMPVVTDVGVSAFNKCSGLSSIDMPATLKTVDNSAFRSCTALVSINMQNVTSMGTYVFAGCTALTDVVLPSASTAIKDGTFKGCTALAYIHIPATVETIDLEAFNGCTALGRLELPSSVKTIKGLSAFGAFKGCTGLTSVYLPGVTSIGETAFEGCTGLSFVDFGDTVPTTLGTNCFETKCPIGLKIKTRAPNTLFATTHTSSTVVTVGENLSPDYYEQYTVGSFTVTICNGVMEIQGNGTLTGGTYNSGTDTVTGGIFSSTTRNYRPVVVSLSFGSEVTEIGSWGFARCTALSSVSFPESNATFELSGDAFNGCTALKTVNLPEKSKMKEGSNNSLFRNCKAMTSFHLPSGFTDTNNFMFAGCSGLTSVILPSTLTRIGQNAFEDCTGLQSINVPANVSIQEGSTGDTWYKGAFQGCKGLASVTISGSTNITKNTFKDCFALRNVSILGNTATIGDTAFIDCKALGSITLPIGVTAIGINAFSGCASLSSVVMNDATTIGNTAFTGCNMTELTLRAGNSAGNTVKNYFNTGKTWTLPGSSQPIKRLILTGTGMTATVNAVKGSTPANGSILVDGSSNTVWVYQTGWAVKDGARYTVTFNPDYAPSNNTILLTDTSGRLSYIPVSSRRGYVFNGWYNGSYPTVTASTAFASDTTLTAKWTPETYRLTLDKNDMTGASDAVAVTYGSAAISGSVPPYARTGYTLAGFQAGGANGVNVINTGGALLSDVKGYTDSSGNWIEPGGVTLFAKWVALSDGKYTVKYMFGNDVVKSTEMTGKTYGKIYSETSEAVAGYIVPAQTKSIVMDGFNPSIVFTCTKMYTVTATSGGNGSISPSGSVSVTHGASQTFTFTPDAGYEVDQVTVDGSAVSPTPSASHMLTNVTIEHTINVTFKPINYTVTFAYNGNVPGGAAAPDKITGKHVGDTETLPTIANVAGYTHTVWKLNGMEVSSPYTMPASDVTLTCTWTANPVSVDFTISYNGNGATSGSVPATVRVNNGTHSLVGNTGDLTKPGYTFDGWSTVINGAVVTSVTVSNANIAVYASWKANMYTVTLVDSLEGSPSFKATYGSDIMAGYSAPVKAGFTFDGYWTAPTGGSAVVAPNGKYASDASGYTSAGKWVGLSDCTLYARWTAVPTTNVSLDTGGASSGSTSVEFGYGAAAAPGGYVRPVKENFEFLGYFAASGTLVIKADGSLAPGVAGITDANGRWIMQGGSLGLAAKWGESKTSVVLDLNGTTYGSTGIVIVAGMTSVPSDYVKPMRYGFEFNGYSTSGTMVISDSGRFAPDVPGMTDANGRWSSKSVSVTLQAQWSAVVGPDPGPVPEGIVKYHANGGSFAGSEEVDGKSFINFDETPTREGYTFLGWAETPDAKAAKYIPGESDVPAYFSLELYSVWVLNEPVPAPESNDTVLLVALGAVAVVVIGGLSVFAIRKLRS